MTTHQRIGFLTLGLILLVASGCAPRPIAKVYRQQAAAEQITFAMALHNPDAYVGRLVVWGGIIIETNNTSSGTDIIVLQTPLGRGERPEGAEYSQGRFIAHSTNLLDPEIYQKGREITLAGVISGKETLPLGGTTYTYPMVDVKQLHLWQKRPQYRYVYPPYYYGYWGPYWGWGPPYWYWGPPYGYFGFYGNFGGREEFHERHERHEPREHHESGGRGEPGGQGGVHGRGTAGGPGGHHR